MELTEHVSPAFSPIQKIAILTDGDFSYFPRSFSAWAMLIFSQG